MGLAAADPCTHKHKHTQTHPTPHTSPSTSLLVPYPRHFTPGQQVL